MEDVDDTLINLSWAKAVFTKNSDSQSLRRFFNNWIDEAIKCIEQLQKQSEEHQKIDEQSQQEIIELQTRNDTLQIENDCLRSARQNYRHGKSMFDFYYMCEKVQRFVDTTALIVYHNKPNIVIMSEEKYKSLIKEPKAFVSVAENNDE